MNTENRSRAAGSEPVSNISIQTKHVQFTADSISVRSYNPDKQYNFPTTGISQPASDQLQQLVDAQRQFVDGRWVLQHPIFTVLGTVFSYFENATSDPNLSNNEMRQITVYVEFNSALQWRVNHIQVQGFVSDDSRVDSSSPQIYVGGNDLFTQWHTNGQALIAGNIVLYTDVMENNEGKYTNLGLYRLQMSNVRLNASYNDFDMTAVPSPSPSPVAFTPGKRAGYFVTAGCGQKVSVWGWACDSNNYSTPLRVAVYLDQFDQAHNLGVFNANASNDTNVAQACGGVGAHSFGSVLENKIPQDDQPHTLIVTGLGLDANGQSSGAQMFNLAPAAMGAQTIQQCQ
ncbi:MAG: hypothetical protein ACYDBJ_04445 [Aggregatilineales bacterium]